MLRFTFFYYANPHSVRIALRGIRTIELPPNVVDFPFDASDPKAAQFVRDIEWLEGIDSVSISATAHEVSIFKFPTVTWAETMMKILRILRDRFAPGQPLTNDCMKGLPRYFDRRLTQEDFQFIPNPSERQPPLFDLD